MSRLPDSNPAMLPVPLGIPVPEPVQKASDAYVKTREDLVAAEAGIVEARKRYLRNRDPYLKAVRQHEDEGGDPSEVRSAGDGSGVPIAESAAEGARQAALQAELVYADAIADHRKAWRADVEAVRTENRDRVQELLRELSAALERQHTLAVLDQVLGLWRYRQHDPPAVRSAFLHKGQKPQIRPDFAAVVREADRHGQRMSQIHRAIES